MNKNSLNNASSIAEQFPNISLVQSNDDRAYVIHNGCRHHVPDAARLAKYGLRWPEDLVSIDENLLYSTRISGWLPELFDKEQSEKNIKSCTTMREFMSAHLNGIGLEVGAGSAPFPVPINCMTLFGDHILYDELNTNLYPGQTVSQLVRPDIKTDFSRFENVADESLDYIIGCHVIEHVFDPIGTLVNAHKKLRKGGQLILVIPDKERTFDKDRPLTTLKHLIQDHESPDKQRDKKHYEEFYRLAFKIEDEKQLLKKVETEFQKRGDLHAHVWNYQTFSEMVEYVDNKLVTWTDIWSHKTLSNVSTDIEFYFRLTK